MYRHQIHSFGKFQKHQIGNESSGNSFTVVSSQGACVLDIQFDNLSILDGCKTPIELDLNNWGKSAILLPFPNRLNTGQYTWQNQSYQFNINDAQNNNAIHGFAMDKSMDITEIELDNQKAMIHCMYQYDGNLEAYPFPFSFSAKFRITDEMTFEVTFQIRNESSTPLPMGMGWHPYFQLSEKLDDMELHFSGCQLIGLDDRMIPTGKRYDYDEFEQARKIRSTVLDNCFSIKDIAQSPFKLSLKGDKGTIQYWQETGSDKFNFIQLFTPPQRQALAIEPMTCNVDAFNNGEGLIRLEPGQEREAKFGIAYSKN